jgi:hypothetical protein
LKFTIVGLTAVLLVAVLGYLHLIADPVTTVADADEDLCGGFAVAKGAPGSPSSLMSRPIFLAREIAKITPGTGLLLCDRSGDWLGVIVLVEGVECIDRSDRRVPRSYLGPCRSGWLRSEDVELFAG